MARPCRIQVPDAQLDETCWPHMICPSLPGYGFSDASPSPGFDQNNLFEHGRIMTPTGCTMFPGELYRPPGKWAEELYNIHHWTVQPAGGHFSALEQPELLAADLREFFRPLR